MNDIVLEAENVTKTFQEGSIRVEVLRGVDLAVARGEIVALEGPSGSGKTTLLSILGCILSPTTGVVRVGGVPVDHRSERALREARRTRIGFVFQSYNLFPSLTAFENIAYSLGVRGHSGADAAREARRVLDQVGLGDRMNFLPRDLSGGQKQRVAIARALAGSPDVVLADEPTANLDSEVGGQILALFHDLARREGRGLLVVTHDPKVRGFADRTLRILDGRLLPGTIPALPPSVRSSSTSTGQTAGVTS